MENHPDFIERLKYSPGDTVPPAQSEDYLRELRELPTRTPKHELERLTSSREPNPDCIDEIVQAAERVAVEVKLE